MRTGRKGYYKRTQAIDKTTTMKINIHDSDDAVGADSDLHNRIFAKSSKALAHHDASVDALDLPFFQLGRHPNQVLSRQAPCDVSNHQAAIEAGPGQVSTMSSAAKVDDQKHDSDSDPELPAAMNPMQVIHHVIPSIAKEKAEAKAKAAAAKSKSKASSRASSGDHPHKKRKGSDKTDADGTASKQPKIMRLQTAVPNQGSTTTPAICDRPALETDADQKLMAEYNELLTEVKKRCLASLGDSDALVNENLKSALKDISSLIKKLKEKKKSLKRRQDVGGVLVTQLDDMIAEVGKAHATATSLANSHGDSDVVASLKELSALHWNVSTAMYKKAFKCQSLAYLKFGDWSAFSASRATMHTELGVTNGEIFFECMTSELIQRLLRSLPTRVSSK